MALELAAVGSPGGRRYSDYRNADRSNRGPSIGCAEDRASKSWGLVVSFGIPEIEFDFPNLG
jgi:hypothetical protein